MALDILLSLFFLLKKTLPSFDSTRSPSDVESLLEKRNYVIEIKKF